MLRYSSFPFSHRFHSFPQLLGLAPFLPSPFSEVISYICNTVRFSFPFSCLVALANGFTKTLNGSDETLVCLGPNLRESIQFSTVKSDVIVGVL